MVANSIEGEVTDGDISYSITLNEAGANPLFDLYVDEGEGGKKFPAITAGDGD